MQVKVTTKLVWRMQPQGHFWRSFSAAVNDAAWQVGQFYRTYLKRLLAIAVGRSTTGKVIQRSKPGEPPRRETADLWRSIAVDQDKKSNYTMIYTNIDYAKELELGSAKIAPRPAWMPAFLYKWRIMAIYIQVKMKDFLDTY